MIRFKTAFLLGAFLIVGWGSYNSFAYFFDTQKPFISLEGVQNEFCSGDVHCNIAINKTGNLALLIDNVPLVEDFNIASKNKPYAFTIPTTHLADGEHQLKVVCTDKSYHRNAALLQTSFFVDNKPLQISFVQSDFNVLQGRTLHIQFRVNKEVERAQVKALAQTYDCFVQSPQSDVYECFIPISCEEKPNEYLFSVEVADKVGNQATLDNAFKITQCTFKKQAIKVEADKMAEEKERGRAIAELEQQLTVLAKGSPKEKLWRGNFCTPIDIQRVTCEFGTIRTTQERGRYAHKALDVINLPKSVVWATQAGVVVLKDRFDFSGNTVAIDHGHGIISLFYHLDDFADIEVGQKVAQGNPIGTLGKTGYATGYHLHWELRVHNMPVDPMQWTKETF